jgi:hypothetical protein
MQNFDQNIGCWEKRQFFRRKLQKIVIITSTPDFKLHVDCGRLLYARGNKLFQNKFEVSWGLAWLSGSASASGQKIVGSNPGRV